MTKVQKYVVIKIKKKNQVYHNENKVRLLKKCRLENSMVNKRNKDKILMNLQSKLFKY